MIYDFHTHSINSDGKGTVDELCGYAIEKKIAGFALTDHADMEYYKENAREKAKSTKSIFRNYCSCDCLFCNHQYHSAKEKRR